MAKPYSYWLLLHLPVNLPQITILISQDQLPSGLVAQLVEQWWSVPEVMSSNPTRVRGFFSFSMWAHFLSRAIDQKVLFGIFIRALQLTTFKSLWLVCLSVFLFLLLYFLSICLSISVCLSICACLLKKANGDSNIASCFVYLGGVTAFLSTAQTCTVGHTTCWHCASEVRCRQLQAISQGGLVFWCWGTWLVKLLIKLLKT